MKNILHEIPLRAILYESSVIRSEEVKEINVQQWERSPNFLINIKNVSLFRKMCMLHMLLTFLVSYLRHLKESIKYSKKYVFQYINDLVINKKKKIPKCITALKCPRKMGFNKSLSFAAPIITITFTFSKISSILDIMLIMLQKYLFY